MKSALQFTQPGTSSPELPTGKTTQVAQGASGASGGASDEIYAMITPMFGGYIASVVSEKHNPGEQVITILWASSYFAPYQFKSEAQTAAEEKLREIQAQEATR